MTSEHIATAICFVVMFAFFAFAIHTDRKRQAPDATYKEIADRLEAAAKRAEKQAASSPLWSSSYTTTTTITYPTPNVYVVTCKHCSQKNRVEVKSGKVVTFRCGKCGLPFSNQEALKN